MKRTFRYNRMEIAGSLGDLGTLLPIAIALIVIVGMPPIGVFFCVGLYYIFSGLYFGITTPVQPMKVVGAYAIATALEPGQIVAATLFSGLLLLFIGCSGTIEFIRRHSSTAVIRGVQLSTGIMLMTSGIRFICGTSPLQLKQQLVEPALSLQYLGALPISLLLGSTAIILLLLFLDNQRYPAALVVILLGTLASLLLGARLQISAADIGLHLPTILPFGLPSGEQISFALLVLVLPQMPMTMGNAVLAYSDLSKKYFGKKSAKVSNRAVCIGMGVANIGSFLLGGIPMCYGAGGLAAHYRFGARTAGSNIFIGSVFLLIVLIFGNKSLQFFNLLPLSVLGALLVFAGGQLAITLIDLREKHELFIAMIVLGITLTTNLAAGFIIGMLAAKFFAAKKISL